MGTKQIYLTKHLLKFPSSYLIPFVLIYSANIYWNLLYAVKNNKTGGKNMFFSFLRELQPSKETNTETNNFCVWEILQKNFGKFA